MSSSASTKPQAVTASTAPATARLPTAEESIAQIRAFIATEGTRQMAELEARARALHTEVAALEKEIQTRIAEIKRLEITHNEIKMTRDLFVT